MRLEFLEVFDICRCLIVGNNNRIKWVNYLLYYGNYKNIELYSYPLFWCKYFNINNVPYPSILIALVAPDYSEISELSYIPNERVLSVLTDALDDMIQVHTSLGDSGLDAFIMGIGSIVGRPCIDPWYLLYYANLGKDKIYKNKAIETMKSNEINKSYTLSVKDNDGDEQVIDCTKYCA